MALLPWHPLGQDTFDDFRGILGADEPLIQALIAVAGVEWIKPKQILHMI